MPKWRDGSQIITPINKLAASAETLNRNISIVKYKTLFLFLFVNLSLLGQICDDEEGLTPLGKFLCHTKYLRFLLFSDSTSQARMLNVGINYLNTPSYTTLKPNGVQLRCGFNLARFVSKKIILGVFIDFKGIKGFTRQRFSSEFISDFNNGFNSNYSSQEDSAKAYLLKWQINNSAISGNYLGDIGIMFSPFPQKYGGILVTLKKGYRSYVIHGVYGNKFIGNGEQEIALLDLSNNYALEVTMKPYAFFNNSFFPKKTTASNEISKLITLSFYYEQTNLKSATFSGLPLENVVSNTFMNKYGKTDCYGFKIGIAIY